MKLTFEKSKTKQQGIYVSYRALQFKDLKLIDKMIYSVLEDRMKSSIKRMNFYDIDRCDYYVVYEQDKMADFLGVHPNTVFNSLKKLNNLGYIDRVEQQYSADKIFMPLSVLTKFVGTFSQNLLANHFIKPLSKNTIGTSVTVNGTYGQNKKENKKNEQKQQSDNSKDNGFNIDGDKNKITFKDRDIKNMLLMGLRNRGMSHDLAYTLDKYSENSNVMYKYAGLIFKTKDSSKKKYKAKGYIEAADALTFEHNEGLSDSIRQAFLNAVISIHVRKDIKNKEAYMARALYTCFDNEVADIITGIDNPMRNYEVDGFNIPIMKLDR
ncbi:hypothetical protein [Apilactobacillus timberlakei]|uniref:Replication initiator protein A C-terminal domain-containing protein n=1 Tax=Apilactobacillus timberlakei TaxID=2008380 RepID=A0ABY2YR53_9LACO|nr:hypothetical protein [Apilactobacillus timberlakei]TPR12411.1 hypothetical protein DY048_07625 [Apilactobacillus timberlakei]TPR12951.1 hypothetical protein DY052_08545 [Apilactobacillus timberlakei]